MFATDAVLLITTTRHDMRELRSYRHSIRGPRSHCPLEVGTGSLLGVRTGVLSPMAVHGEAIIRSESLRANCGERELGGQLEEGARRYGPSGRHRPRPRPQQARGGRDQAALWPLGRLQWVCPHVSFFREVTSAVIRMRRAEAARGAPTWYALRPRGWPRIDWRGRGARGEAAS